MKKPPLLDTSSGANQEQEILLRLLAAFRHVWDNRRRTYLAEEGQRQKDILNDGGKHSFLAKKFAQHGVDYEKEILPIFAARWSGFLHLWAGRRAAEETVKDYQAWMKPYQSAVRLIIQREAPFPEEVKARLQGWPPPLKLEDILLREAQTYIEEDQGIKVLDRNVEKNPYKHPVWRTLQRELSDMLRERKISQTQTDRLIVHLFETLLPDWYDVKYGEDGIRLTRTYHKRKKK